MNGGVLVFTMGKSPNTNNNNAMAKSSEIYN